MVSLPGILCGFLDIGLASPRCVEVYVGDEC
jgi:hypothetical protein